jgi:hypothetical protein
MLRQLLKDERTTEGVVWPARPMSQPAAPAAAAAAAALDAPPRPSK